MSFEKPLRAFLRTAVPHVFQLKSLDILNIFLFTARSDMSHNVLKNCADNYLKKFERVTLEILHFVRIIY